MEHKLSPFPPPNLEGERAVIVEDEGITVLVLRKTLRSAGMEVVGTAANGKEAVEVVLSLRPDLVLMDINIPMMTGLEAARRILAEYPVCIVMLTAYEDEGYRQQAKEVGAWGYILKPFIKETLLAELRQAFAQYNAPNQETKN